GLVRERLARALLELAHLVAEAVAPGLRRDPVEALALRLEALVLRHRGEVAVREAHGRGQVSALGHAGAFSWGAARTPWKFQRSTAGFRSQIPTSAPRNCPSSLSACRCARGGCGCPRAGARRRSASACAPSRSPPRRGSARGRRGRSARRAPRR